METSIYRKLNEAKKEIRLISLHPVSPVNEGVQVDIIYTSLENPVEYEAISYTRGSAKDTCNIYVDGRDFIARRNLESVLLHLRLPHKNRILWIDAIRINQNDFTEKNMQVPMMHLVYGKARRVLVWLGVESKNSKEAIEFMNEICKDHQIVWP